MREDWVDAPVQLHPVHSREEVQNIVTQLAMQLDEADARTRVFAEQLIWGSHEMDITRDGRWIPLVAMMSGTPEPLSMHDCFVLQDAAQSIAGIAAASVAELRDMSLDRETAMAVHAFFDEETVA
ncbi:hypothetical protein HKX48_004864 [Thoreauomyces humboldtii]|nr:hypothetical protein HKX48_004864 [Thoreauomyces humboldtii]